MESEDAAPFAFDASQWDKVMDEEIDKLLKEAWEKCDDQTEAQQDEKERESVASGPRPPPHIPPECSVFWEKDANVPDVYVTGDLYGDVLDKVVDVRGVLQVVFAWDLMPDQIAEAVRLLNDRRPRLLKRKKLYDCFKVVSGEYTRCVGFDHIQELVASVGHHFGMLELPAHVKERASLLETNLRTFRQMMHPLRLTPPEMRYRRTQRYLMGDNAERLRESKRRRDQRYRIRRAARESKLVTCLRSTMCVFGILTFDAFLQAGTVLKMWLRQFHRLYRSCSPHMQMSCAPMPCSAGKIF
jgi:hypothetical protein